MKIKSNKSENIKIINTQEWAEEKNAKRDPFAFEPQYFVISKEEADELLNLDPSLEEREISF